MWCVFTKAQPQPYLNVYDSKPQLIGNGLDESFAPKTPFKTHFSFIDPAGCLLPECDLIFIPFQSLDCVALLSQVAFQFGSKLVWDATAGPLHCPGKSKSNTLDHPPHNRFNFSDFGQDGRSFLSSYILHLPCLIAHQWRIADTML